MLPFSLQLGIDEALNRNAKRNLNKSKVREITIFVGGLVGYYTYAQTGFLAISNERAAITWFPVLVRWGGNVPNLDSNVIMTSFVTQSMDNASVAVPLILVTKTWIGSMFGFDRMERGLSGSHSNP